MLPQYPKPGDGQYYTMRNQVPLAPDEELAFRAGHGYYARHRAGAPYSGQTSMRHPISPSPSGPPTGYASYPQGTPTPGQGIGGPAMPEDGPFEPGGPQGVVAWGGYRDHQPTTDIQHGVGGNPLIEMLRARIAAMGGNMPGAVQNVGMGPVPPNIVDQIRQALAHRLIGM